MMTVSQTTLHNLVAIARAYGKATGRSLSSVSKEVYGQATFFERASRGEVSVTLSKLDDMLDWFGEHWPKGTRAPLLRPVFMDRTISHR